MENVFGLATVTSIVVICYLAGEAVKIFAIHNKYIPVICGVLGGILGLLGMFSIADFPANDYLSAIAVGIVSGLAATGFNQLFKQVGGKKK